MNPAPPTHTASAAHNARAAMEIPGWAGLAGVCAMIALAGLHWGGAYPHVGAWSYIIAALPAAVLIWFFIRGLLLGRAPGDILDLAVSAFLTYAAWTYTRTPVEYTARLELLWIFTYAIVFWSVRYSLPGRRAGIVLVAVIILVGAISTVYAFIHRADPMHPIWGLPAPNYGVRISGTFGCPNHFANFLVTAVLGALALGACPRLPWPLRIISFYCAIMMTAGVVFSISRGAYLAWLAGCGVAGLYFLKYFPLRWYWKIPIILLPLVGAVAGVALYGSAMQRVEQALSGDIRIQLAYDTIGIWQTAPIWGRGIGSFDYLHLRMHAPDIQSRAMYAHNDYLNTLADYGVVGFAIILFFLFLCAWMLVRRIRLPAEAASDLRRLWAWLGLAALAAMAVHSVFDFSLHIPACPLAFFAVLGLGLQRPVRDWPPRPFYLNPAILLAIGIAVLAIVLHTRARVIIPAHNLFPPGDNAVREMDEPQLEALAGDLLALDPKAAPLIERIGDAYRVKAARLDNELRGMAGTPADSRRERIRERERLGQVALSYYRMAHESAPLDDTLLVKQAFVLDILQRHAEAYLAYAEALRNRPNSRYFHLVMGYHLAETGDYPEALQRLETAAAIRRGTREDPQIHREAVAALRILRQRIEQP